MTVENLICGHLFVIITFIGLYKWGKGWKDRALDAEAKLRANIGDLVVRNKDEEG